jgi:uronate dehydrogenase
MKKIVLTGAAGRLGSYLREPLSKLADELVRNDIVDDIGNIYTGETYVKADLSQLSEIIEVLADADMVVHFGAIGDEAPWGDILNSNIVGAYNIWEAAHQNGVKRVVYASSIHAVGMHAGADNIGVDVAHKPDTYYGLAKCFAEDLASLYWDKRGIESVCMRICSCAQVNNVRALGTWLSYEDLIEMVERAVLAPDVGFEIVYGVSNNDRSPLDNSNAAVIGFDPKDNAEQFAEKVLSEAGEVNYESPELSLVGGPFATVKLGNSGTASMNIVDDAKES